MVRAGSGIEEPDEEDACTGSYNASQDASEEEEEVEAVGTLNWWDLAERGGGCDAAASAEATAA